MILKTTVVFITAFGFGFLVGGIIKKKKATAKKNNNNNNAHAKQKIEMLN